MSLTHVYIWETGIGYRHITVEEASEKYPHTVPAKARIFVCGICGDWVTLTKKRKGGNARHFRHESSKKDKECEDRAKAYSNAKCSYNSHEMPIRIKVSPSDFTLELGFFTPLNPPEEFHCASIRISCDHYDPLQFSFERLEEGCCKYLDIGCMLTHEYQLEYEQPTDLLRKYWPRSIRGIHPKGSFFDGSTGKMLPVGAHAAADREYYFLHDSSYFNPPDSISLYKIRSVSTPDNQSWTLYRLRINNFCNEAARFFIERNVFLTESQPSFYVIWPPHIESPYFIYFKQKPIFFYLQGTDFGLRQYPANQTQDRKELQNGWLYIVKAQDKDQLVTVGATGALGFYYLQCQDLQREAGRPKVLIEDLRGNSLQDDLYTHVPESHHISVIADFDGVAKVYRKNCLEYIYEVIAGTRMTIEVKSLSTEIKIFQGCDCIRCISFEKEQNNVSMQDIEMVALLNACRGETIPISHSLAAMAEKLSGYPRTKAWLRNKIRQGKMPISAYKHLKWYICNKK